MSATNKPTYAISWYSREAWRELRAMPEAKIADTSYEEFVRKAERAMSAAKDAYDVEFIKFDINVAEMTAWCHRNGYKIDEAGRGFYCVALHMARDNGEPMPVRDHSRVVQ